MLHSKIFILYELFSKKFYSACLLKETPTNLYPLGRLLFFIYAYIEHCFGFSCFCIVILNHFTVVFDTL